MKWINDFIKKTKPKSVITSQNKQTDDHEEKESKRDNIYIYIKKK